MMKAVAKAVEPAEREVRFEHIRPLYLEALTLVDRLHRRLLDVIKDEFDRRSRADINSVQALLLYNIGEKELTAGELRTRGYYLGSNVSYNLKKLVEMGFLDHQRSRVDRRSVRIKLTDKGREVRDIVDALYQKHVRTVEQVGGINSGRIRTCSTSRCTASSDSGLIRSSIASDRIRLGEGANSLAIGDHSRSVRTGTAACPARSSCYCIIRLTVQRFDVSDDPRRVERVIDRLRSDAILLYATDFPHWQFDGDETVPAAIPSSLRHKLTASATWRVGSGMLSAASPSERGRETLE